MESKKWEALLAAVDAGSFSRAADALGYTQSGLTHMMNALEKEVGFSLLERGHYGVRLSSNGQRLLSAIQEFTRSSSRLEREIESVSSAKAESIRVAAYASIAVHWLPAIVRRFRAEHPGVQVDIHLVNSAEELCARVLEDRSDLGFGACPHTEDFPALHWQHLRDDPLLAVLPTDYPLTQSGCFPLEEFEGQEFLISSQGFDPTILATMERLGIHPNIRPSAVDDQTVITLVGNGLGVSMLTELVLEGSRENILALPVQPAAFRQLGIVSCSGRNTTANLRHFFSCAAQTVEELYRQKSEQSLEKHFGNLAI